MWKAAERRGRECAGLGRLGKKDRQAKGSWGGFQQSWSAMAAVRAEKSPESRGGVGTHVSHQRPWGPGCCHLDPRATAEIAPVLPPTLSLSQWRIWAPPPPQPDSGRLLALGDFCYELIKLTLSS